MNGVWLVVRNIHYEGSEILNVFSDKVELHAIKSFVIENQFRPLSTSADTEWREDNTIYEWVGGHIEISFMTFDDAELLND